MATAQPQAPPAIPALEAAEIHHQQHLRSSPEEALEEADMLSKVPIRSSQPVVQVTNSLATQADKSNKPVKDTEVAQEKKDGDRRRVEDNGNPEAEAEDDDPRNPLTDFDWSDFETRYKQAMKEANQKEEKLRHDFEHLVQYFGAWTTSASNYDNERSYKRIKTRTLYVQHAEETLEQKKQHYSQVVQAFQSALALLG